MEITLDERWAIGGKAHGGYLLRETVAPALTEAHPHPLAVSAHFLRSPDPGSATVELETLRTGRRAAQHRARLVQDDQTCLEVLLTSGGLDPASDPYWTGSTAPVLPDVDDCPRSPAEPVPGLRIGHLDFVEVRPDPATNRWSGATPPPGRVAAWLQSDPAPTTTLDLLVLADAMQPVPMAMGVAGWFPTVELTVLVRAVPADGWLIGEQTTQLMQDGWFEEDCTLWDSRGRVVCQARQLAGYRL